MKLLTHALIDIDKTKLKIILNFIKHIQNVYQNSKNPSHMLKKLSLIYSTILFGSTTPESKTIQNIVLNANVI